MKIKALPELVNNNPVLLHRGRYLTTTFMLEIGDEQYIVKIDDGRVTNVSPATVMPSWTFALRASEETWEKFWQVIPEPGYNDIMALVRFGRMRLEGNLHPLMANLLYINQFPDRKADIQANKLHWVARLSPNVARWGYVLIASLAWLTLVTLVVAEWLPLLALISALPAFLSIKAARILLQNAERPQNLAPAIQMTILVMLAHGALLTLALVLDSLVRA